MDRQAFLKNISAGIIGFSVIPVMAKSNFQDTEELDKGLVKEFVGKSHSDPERVRMMLRQHPTLLNAAHDWKYGDFETGLGAASHVGQLELVKYFLDQGAQANVFTMALFGLLEPLKMILDYSPKTLYAKGPHGFTLLHHAEKGGEQALAVKDYLIFAGLTKAQLPLY